MQIKDADVWKASKPWVRDAGVWKAVQKGWVKDAGVWKPFYSAGPDPFYLSGTWATNLEGWAGTLSWTSTSRTAPGALRGAGEVTYTLPAEMCGGLIVKPSVWGSFGGGSGPWRYLHYRIGTGPFVQLGSASAGSWVLMSGSFLAPPSSNVTIRISSDGGNNYFDDWIIEGVAP
jgi:hypothetical protein